MKNLTFGFFCLLLLIASPVDATKKKKKDKSKTESSQTAKSKAKKGPYKDFKELTKEAKHIEGFFEMYHNKDKLYLLIPKSRLGEQFLISSQIADGIGVRGLNGGTMLDWEGNVVSFQQNGDQIFLVKHNTRFTANENSATAIALNHSIGDSILASTKLVSIKNPKTKKQPKPVKAPKADKKKKKKKHKEDVEASPAEPAKEEPKGEETLVIDIGGWMISDISQLGEMVKWSLSSKPGKKAGASLDKSRSYLKSAEGFPENINIQANLTFKPSKDTFFATVSDNRYLPLSVYYVWTKLPEDPMTPRLADERVGNFTTVKKDFSKLEDNFFVRYARKWRLEPGEKDGDLYLPKKPIVYYLDPSIPEEYRAIMKEGVENWNAAFEAAGFKNAIKAEMLPEGAHAADTRYATIRWITSDQPRYGAIGPSMVDPRTGEVLDADILFESNIIPRFRNAWSQMGQGDAAFDFTFNFPEDQLALRSVGIDHQAFADAFHNQAGMVQATLIARDQVAADGEFPAEFVNQALKYVVMHEVGHTLGLYHNFRSSSDTPNDKLHDKAWTGEHGLTGSVMDYAAANIAPRGVENGHYYSPVVGTADKWAISYAYTPSDEKAAEIARQGAKDGHAYGNDWDARGMAALDPLTNVNDLGQDPIAWGEQRLELIQELWKELPKRALTDNAEYADLTDMYLSTFFQSVNTILPVIKFVGGQYTYRDHVGDPNGRPPYAPVEVEKQREALAFLDRHVFGAEAFDVPQELLRQVGGKNWLHWGVSPSFDGRRDFPYHSQVSRLQARTLAQLTADVRLATMREAEHKFGEDKVLTVPQLMGHLTESIWSEVWEKPGANINANRRQLQRAYLARLESLTIRPGMRAPADVRAVARMQLTDLSSRLDQRLSGVTFDFDDYTRAHLMESQQRIEKALEAGLDLKR